MFSFNDVADTSSHVPAFNGFNPSQLRYIEKSSLNSTYDLSAEEQFTALSKAAWIICVIFVPAGIGTLPASFVGTVMASANSALFMT